MGPVFFIVWTIWLSVQGVCSGHKEEWRDIGDILQPDAEDFDFPDAIAYVGKLFLYPIPSELKATSIKVVEAGKGTLPNWLHFNDSSNMLQGLPTLSDQGPVYINVHITNPIMDNTQIFQITVKSLPAIVNLKAVKQLNYISNNMHHRELTEQFMTYKSFTCEPYEITFIATLQVNIDMEDISAEERIDIVRRYAHFVSKNAVDLTFVTSSSVKHPDIHILAAGPGNAQIDESLHKVGVDLSWTVACGTFSEIQNFEHVLEHNIGSKRIPGEIGYDVIGWRIESHRALSELRQSRHHLRHIRAVQTPVPTPVFTASSVPSTVVIPSPEQSQTAMHSAGSGVTDQVRTQRSTIAESSSTIDLTASETVDISPTAVQTMLSESVHASSTSGLFSEVSSDFLPSSSLSVASSSLISSSALESSLDIQSSTSTPLLSRTSSIEPSSSSSIASSLLISGSALESSLYTLSSTSTPLLSRTSFIEPSVTSEPVSSSFSRQTSVSIESSYVDVFSSLTMIVTSVIEDSTSFVSESFLTESLDSTLVQSEPSMTSYTIQSTELATSSLSMKASSMSFDERTSFTPTVEFMSSTVEQLTPSSVLSLMSSSSDNMTPSPTSSHDLPVTSTVLQSEYFTILPTGSSVSFVPTSSFDSTAIFTTPLSSSNLELTSLTSNVPSVVMSSTVEDISSTGLSESSSPLQSLTALLTASSVSVISSSFVALESSTVGPSLPVFLSSSQPFSSTDLAISASILDSSSVLSVASSSLIEATSVFSLSTDSSFLPDATSTAIPSSSFSLTSSFSTSFGPSIISTSTTLISDFQTMITSAFITSSSISPSFVSSTATRASSSFLPSFTESYSVVSPLSYKSTTMFIPVSTPVTSSLMVISSIYISQSSSYELPTMFISSSSPILSSPVVFSSSNDFVSSAVISSTSSYSIQSSQASLISSEIILSSSTDLFKSSSFLSPSSSQFISTTSLVSSISRMYSSTVDAIVSSSNMGLSSSSISMSWPTSTSLPVSSTQPVVTTTVAPDHPPVLYNPIDIINVRLGEYFTYKIPSDTFHDFEDGDTNKLSLHLQPVEIDTNIVRTWVKLNTSTSIIYGLPVMNDLMPFSGTRVRVEFILTAEDTSGLLAHDALYIEIDTTNIYTLSFIFYATFEMDYTTFIKDVDILIQLLSNVGAFYGDDNLDFITVYNIFEGSVEIAWSNNSVTSQYCDNTTIRTLYEKLIQTDKGSQMEIPSQIFQNTMLPFIVKSVNYTLEGVCLGQGIGVIPPRPTVIIGLATQSLYNIWLSTILPAVVIAVLLFLVGLILFIFYRYRRHRGHMKPEDKVTYVNNRKPLFLPQEVEMHETPTKPARSTVLDRDREDPSVRHSYPSTSQPTPPQYKLPRDAIFEDIFGPVNSPPPSYHSGNSTPTRLPPVYKLPPPYQPKMNSSDV
ncbi:unnamed protein product [Owenia fusiformis]|uniref:Dystroglycan 1 n=1 Tax=Owenia fusiformis TaxID=6347 RepID=A0A8J1ULS7_OWEFU|nr:unnamed protein product [Owenia fusiformis]